jgi:hypothetical protein
VPAQRLGTLLRRLAVAILLTAAMTTNAAIKQRFLQVTGTGGETGSGMFSWDDSVVPDGGTLTESDLVALSITISGGAFATPQSYDLSDCFYLRARPTPTFETQLTFTCNNGEENFIAFGADSNQSILGNSGHVLTWTIGQPPPPVVQPIPSLSVWASLLMVALMVLLGTMRLRHAQ